jgi:hypothetical protein
MSLGKPENSEFLYSLPKSGSYRRATSDTRWTINSSSRRGEGGGGELEKFSFYELISCSEHVACPRFKLSAVNDCILRFKYRSTGAAGPERAVLGYALMPRGRVPGARARKAFSPAVLSWPLVRL